MIADLSEEGVAQRIYDKAKEYYARKSQILAEATYLGMKNIREKRPEVTLVEITFTDGSKRIRVVVDLDKALETEGKEVMRALEKAVMLGVIDEKWKNHLREMDELRTAAQNAVFEQKDPLLVYKFESFNLFQAMLKEINEQVISLVYKSEIEVPKDNVQQSKVKRDDFSRMKAKHDGSGQDPEGRRQAHGHQQPGTGKTAYPSRA